MFSLLFSKRGDKFPVCSPPFTRTCIRASGPGMGEVGLCSPFQSQPQFPTPFLSWDIWPLPPASSLCARASRGLHTLPLCWCPNLSVLLGGGLTLKASQGTPAPATPSDLLKPSVDQRWQNLACVLPGVVAMKLWAESRRVHPSRVLEGFLSARSPEGKATPQTGPASLRLSVHPPSQPSVHAPGFQF